MTYVYRRRHRALSGEQHPNAKLSEEQALELLYLWHYYPFSFTHLQLARRYGISTSQVQRMVTGQAWRHLTEEPTGPPETDTQ